MEAYSTIINCKQSSTADGEGNDMNQTKNEYSAKEVAQVTGWSQPKVCMLAKRGQIKPTRRGIAPVIWVKEGTTP
jgi:hypothetical protein